MVAMHRSEAGRFKRSMEIRRESLRFHSESCPPWEMARQTWRTRFLWEDDILR